QEQFELSEYGGMFISPQQQAINFRYRTSDVGYQSDWHVAGDPTLIIIQQGALEIELRKGDKRTFGQGDCFIAADYLPQHIALDNTMHGHRARVLGDRYLAAIHIKLARI
ncbi:MAG: hypothetical protein AAGJ37_17025, partial [Pseudomonadota bacterium]